MNSGRQSRLNPAVRLKLKASDRREVAQIAASRVRGLPGRIKATRGVPRPRRMNGLGTLGDVPPTSALPDLKENDKERQARQAILKKGPGVPSRGPTNNVPRVNEPSKRAHKKSEHGVPSKSAPGSALINCELTNSERMSSDRRLNVLGRNKLGALSKIKLEVPSKSNLDSDRMSSDRRLNAPGRNKLGALSKIKLDVPSKSKFSGKPTRAPGGKRPKASAPNNEHSKSAPELASRVPKGHVLSRRNHSNRARKRRVFSNHVLNGREWSVPRSLAPRDNVWNGREPSVRRSLAPNGKGRPLKVADPRPAGPIVAAVVATQPAHVAGLNVADVVVAAIEVAEEVEVEVEVVAVAVAIEVGAVDEAERAAARAMASGVPLSP